jgi:hypothetical protein
MILTLSCAFSGSLVLDVAWGKHTPAHYKYQHAATEKAAAVSRSDILPVITVRNPWRWMQSMCKNPYAAKWPHHEQCPNLQISSPVSQDGTKWNEVTVKYGVGSETYLSLQHLWNDWYNGYLNVSLPSSPSTLEISDEASYPWIMVRMEDLVFHTVETITAVCECAGGHLYPNQSFYYLTESAKADSPGHDTSTGLTQAWIKYSRPLPPEAGFVRSDYDAARSAIDPTLMQLLQYHHPPLPE